MREFHVLRPLEYENVEADIEVPVTYDSELENEDDNTARKYCYIFFLFGSCSWNRF